MNLFPHGSELYSLRKIRRSFFHVALCHSESYAWELNLNLQSHLW